MIECKLMPISDSPWFAPSSNKVKYGLYSSSCYWSIRGFGKKCWVIIANIDVDHEKYLNEGKTIEEIVVECIEYLNTPPKSKYGKKRKRKPVYGLFHKKPHTVKLLEKSDKKYIQALLIIDEKKNKYFWGEGESIKVGRKNR